MVAPAASETAAAETREDAATAWTEGCADTAHEIEWELTLEKKGDKNGLGVSLFDSPTSLAVQAIGDGLILDWNRENPNYAVRRGDVITAVNGQEGNAKAAYAAMRCERIVRLKFKRVPRFQILLAVDSRTLLGLSYGHESMEVRTVVDGGCIDTYNKSCKPGYQVIPGDTIVAVNTVKGDVGLMLNELHVAGQQKVLIER